ncbi:MAG: hypothetical protein IJ786_03015 [Bacteroidaceae bacterium]|nr:hypothetical protein [Bacteroidaceae bacterium]
MNTLKLCVMSLAMALVALPVPAQNEIETAIQQLVSHKKVESSSTLNVSKQPTSQATSTPAVYGRCKIINFVCKRKYQQLVTDIQNAITNQVSNPNCYTIMSYRPGNGEQPRKFNIMYGEGSDEMITIGNSRSKNYVFANIVDQEPPSNGQYRTNYCLEWYDIPGAKEISGRVIVSYARIPLTANGLTKMPANTYTAELSYEMPQVPDVLGLQAALAKDNPLAVIQSMILLAIENPDSGAMHIYPIMYAVIRDAVKKNAFTADERHMLVVQLKRLLPSSAVSTDAAKEMGYDYVRLSIKVLTANQVPD